MNRFSTNKLRIFTGSYLNIDVYYTCTTDIKQTDKQPQKYISEQIDECTCTEGCT